MERMIYKYCVVIGVDGMGGFNAQANTPNLDKIFASGATTYHALSMDPTISAENWGAMLLGATPVVHGLTNGIVGSFEYTNTALPSVFTRLRRAFPDAYLTSCVNWNPINYGVIEHNVGVDLVTADNDDQLTPLIVERVAKKPKFLFVQFDDVDGAGHGKTYGSEAYLEAVSHADALIGEVFDAYEKAGILEDTLFVVTADHGGIRRGHGGYTDTEKYVFLGVRGKGVEKSEIGYARTKDIAAIVLYALGVEAPAYDINGFSSQVPEGIFTWTYPAYLREAAAGAAIETRPTPAFRAENGLTAYFDPARIRLAMFFDHSIKDETGNCSFREVNLIKYYSNGVCDACGEFGTTGYAVTDDLRVGADSFSVAVWLKLDRSLVEGAVVCGTRDWWWENRRCAGFSLVLKNNDAVFSIGTGKDNLEVVTPFPGESAEGWLHMVAVVDRTRREIRIYYNFKFVRSFPLNDCFLTDLTATPFVVGNDAGFQHNDKTWPAIFRMDDLFIFDGAFTDAEVERLKAYYEA